jgi:NAD(P)-dependent dehydrogenase (short-subunit alcohol dehydrogenase family)
VRGIEVDVGTAEGAAKLIEQVPETNILVNNLGIYELKNFSDITDDEWLNLFEINVLSGIRLARHYFPRMLAKNSGRVIFISSESGIAIPIEMVHYGMTKAAQLAIFSRHGGTDERHESYRQLDSSGSDTLRRHRWFPAESGIYTRRAA